MKKFVILLSASILLAGCEPSRPTSSQTERRSVEANQNRLITAIPAPTLETSLERKNLAERLTRINQQNMSGYVYLLSYGRVVASYPIRGKVTSLNAYLMGSEKPEDDPNGTMDAGSIMLEQPDFDGAYGKNADGVFFFTADSNAYVEWAGDYLFSDQPLKLNQEPMMVREVK
jgi:hypothetical protein